jgi:hypothetical protein
MSKALTPSPLSESFEVHMKGIARLEEDQK